MFPCLPPDAQNTRRWVELQQTPIAGITLPDFHRHVANLAPAGHYQSHVRWDMDFDAMTGTLYSTCTSRFQKCDNLPDFYFGRVIVFRLSHGARVVYATGFGCHCGVGSGPLGESYLGRCDAADRYSDSPP